MDVFSTALKFEFDVAVVLKSNAECDAELLRDSRGDDLNEDIASRNPKSDELAGDALCCLSNANNRSAVTA